MTRVAAAVLFFVALIFGGASTAAAQSTGTACAAVQDGQERLSCYDALFRTKTEAGPAEGTGKWQLQTETSKLDDSKEVYLQVPSDEVVSDTFGRQGQAAQLMLRCQGHTTMLTVWFAGRFMADSGGYDKVTYRIDKNKAVTSAWSASTDNKHMGLWSGGASIPLIKSLFGATNLLVVATPFNDNSLSLDFKVGGIEEAIKPLRAACGW